jgi:hypothetical protein
MVISDAFEALAARDRLFGVCRAVSGSCEVDLAETQA